MNMFLSRVCGEPIGFTVLKIFVIDRNTILTVSKINQYLDLRQLAFASTQTNPFAAHFVKFDYY